MEHGAPELHLDLGGIPITFNLSTVLTVVSYSDYRIYNRVHLNKKLEVKANWNAKLHGMGYGLCERDY